MDPCEDFYEFACGKFIATQQIPPNDVAQTTIKILRQKVNQRVKGEAPSSMAALFPRATGCKKEGSKWTGVYSPLHERDGAAFSFELAALQFVKRSSGRKFTPLLRAECTK